MALIFSSVYRHRHHPMEAKAKEATPLLAPQYH